MMFGKKKMSTGKKVAIGVAAGVTTVGVGAFGYVAGQKGWGKAAGAKVAEVAAKVLRIKKAV